MGKILNKKPNGVIGILVILTLLVGIVVGTLAYLILLLGLFFFFGCYCLQEVRKESKKRLQILQQAMDRAEVDRNLDDVQPDNLEDSLLSSYVIPTECPTCGEPISLRQLEWTNENSFVCMKCGIEVIIDTI